MHGIIRMDSSHVICQHQYNIHRNGVNLQLKPLSFGYRTRSTFNNEAFRQWESHAIYGVETFKQNNMYFRHDPWYRNMLLRQIHISVTSNMFPRIEAFLPEDEPARKMFAWLGSPVGAVLDRFQGHMYLISKQWRTWASCWFAVVCIPSSQYNWILHFLPSSTQSLMGENNKSRSLRKQDS